MKSTFSGPGTKSRQIPLRRALIRVGAILLLAVGTCVSVNVPASASTSPALSRYPYLTDSTQSSITVNWATNTSATTGSVQWGPAGSCAANTTAATRTAITVISTAEYQWAAPIPVSPDTTYCYRVLLAGTDLLGTDPSPQFTSQVAAGSTAPFSFAVFGDWGQAYAGGINADQTNLLSQISSSGARFAVMTGDTAYPGGGQGEYGDLQQSGVDVSTIFGPTFWTVPGRSIPVYNVVGNHGFTAGAVQLLNWPEQNAAAASGGRYVMENYPSINGTTAKSYPSAWYAVDAGNTRLYMLTAAWADGNIGSSTTPYEIDQLAHWRPGTAEYEWLKGDLLAHPNAVKMAFWHYPLFADSSGQPSDTFLQGGSGTLQGLLNENNVAIVFNGHAHGYERNVPDAAGMVSYVVGNGGAALGRVSGCSAFDAYAIGSGGSHCGAGPAGLSNSQVFGFVKVTVDGRRVTVTPTSSLGATYDVQTYTVPANETDGTPPGVPANLTASAAGRGQVNLSWSASSDNVGVTGYLVYRNGSRISSLTGTGTTFSDLTVAPAKTYSYQVSAIDAAGNESAKQAVAVSVLTTGPADTQAPSQPGNLTASAPSSSTVNLSWTASSDDVRVLGYTVTRGGLPLSSTPDDGTTFQDEAATPGTNYTYQVAAFDAAGNNSPANTVTVTTPTGSAGGATLTFAPTDDATIDSANPAGTLGTTNRLTVDNSPANDFLLKFTVTGTGAGTSCPSVASAKLRLTVGSTANDNAPKGGDFRGAANSNWTEAGVTWNTAPAAMAGPPVASVVTPVALSTAYLVDVSALVTGNSTFTIRAAGNSSDGARYFSRNGNPTTIAPELQVACGPPDIAPPSKPGTPTPTAITGTSVDIAWTASTDNVGVTAYRVFRDGVQLAQLPDTPTVFHDSGLAPGSTHRYTTKAVDGAGNASAESGALTVTTPTGGDTSAPSAPTGLTAGAATTTSVPLSWAASSDNVGVTGYQITRNNGTVAGTTVIGTASGTSFNDTGLTAATTYTYAVNAFDAAGNRSTAGNPVTATTAGASTLTFAPTDDATIDSANPAINTGMTNRITVDSSPVNDLLLKFTVAGTGPGTGCPTINAAKLRLTVGSTANDNSPKGGDFRGAANSNWTEAAVTWNTAPAASAGPPVAGISTPVALGTAYLVDLSALVTGNSTFTIRATGNSSDGARYFSRNGNPATVAPELEISCG